MSERATLEAFAAWRKQTGDWEPWVAEDRCPQGAFLRAAEGHRARVFRAGNRTGKTEVGAVDTALHVLGIHPWGRFAAPVEWWVSGVDREHGIGTVMWPALKRFLPASSVNWKKVSWHRARGKPEIPLAVPLLNGSLIVFKSADSGREKYQGGGIHGTWVDEEHPEDVIEELRTRLVDHGGYFTATLTPLRRERWVQELERRDGTFLARASLMDAVEAGIVDREEAEGMLAYLSPARRLLRGHGDYVSLEGRVYPDFSETTHVAQAKGSRLVLDGDTLAPWPLPEHWLRWAAMDFGFDNAACVPMIAEEPGAGRLFVERCYYQAGVEPSRWGEYLSADLPELATSLVCDHDSADQAELRRAGVPTRPALKGPDSVRSGLRVVERWIGKRLDDGHPSLILCSDPATRHPKLGRCDGRGDVEGREGLCWELGLYEMKNDKPVKHDDHACDALRYLLTMFERSPRKPRRSFDLGPSSRGGYDTRVTGNV